MFLMIVDHVFWWLLTMFLDEFWQCFWRLSTNLFHDLLLCVYIHLPYKHIGIFDHDNWSFKNIQILTDFHADQGLTPTPPCSQRARHSGRLGGSCYHLGRDFGLQSTHFEFVQIHGKPYENMHLSFLMRRANISGILVLFDAVWPRTMRCHLSKRAELARSSIVLARAL
jgi:hypothetical protein